VAWVSVVAPQQIFMLELNFILYEKTVDFVNESAWSSNHRKLIDTRTSETSVTDTIIIRWATF
jgi:hypothetical protein